MIVNSEIKKFIKMVEASWSALLSGDEEPGGARDDLICDWLQFHWELLVEGKIRSKGLDVRLEVYGDGAETESGRIFPASAVTHRICCLPRNRSSLVYDLVTGTSVDVPDEGFTVDRFAFFNEGFVQYEPPFNAVTVSDRLTQEPVLLDMEGLDFCINEV